VCARPPGARGLRLIGVAEVAHAHEIGRIQRVALDLAPQSADVDRHEIAVRAIVDAPDALQQLPRAEHTAGVLHQVVEQLKLALGQVLLAVALDHHPPLHRVEVHAADGDRLVGAVHAQVLIAVAPHHRLDAREQLGRVVRLLHDVVGAELQRAHPVRHAALLGQKDDRRVVLRPDLVAQGVAAGVRAIFVKQQQVGLAKFQRLAQAVLILLVQRAVPNVFQEKTRHARVHDVATRYQDLHTPPFGLLSACPGRAAEWPHSPEMTPPASSQSLRARWIMMACPAVRRSTSLGQTLPGSCRARAPPQRANDASADQRAGRATMYRDDTTQRCLAGGSAQGRGAL
jgi:hypothetical protein